VNPATGKPANGEEPIDAIADDTEIGDDAEAEPNSEPPVNESTPTQAEAEQLEVTEPLDTGVVPAAKSTAKKPIPKPIKSVVEADVEAKVKPVVKKPEANTAKLPVIKPAETVAVVKQSVKKPESNTVKPVTSTKPENPAAASEKTTKPELVRWTILAGSFGQKDHATTLMKSLREQGIPVTMETTQAAKGPIYKLKVGPELDKKKAEANKAKLDKQKVDNVLIAE
jgi:DedD protein